MKKKQNKRATQRMTENRKIVRVQQGEGEIRRKEKEARNRMKIRNGRE